MTPIGSWRPRACQAISPHLRRSVYDPAPEVRFAEPGPPTACARRISGFGLRRKHDGLHTARTGLSPLLSAYACAVPAILATRTIENKRDRIATILIAPFMTCSARLPVYTLIIAAFIPERRSCSSPPPAHAALAGPAPAGSFLRRAGPA